MARREKLIVVGAGVMGLWTAYLALGRGYDVMVLDAADRIGCGASGGVVGALAPHLPDRWNPKKQFQFDALCALPDQISALEAETGMSAGYDRLGRAQPVRPGHLRFLEERLAGAERHWGKAAKLQLKSATAFSGWAEGPEDGWMVDDLSARLSPRRLLAALAEGITLRGGEILFNKNVIRLGDGWVETPHQRHDGDALVLAAGVAGFELLSPMLQTLTGRAEKGQAALLRGSAPADMPFFYADGVYVLPHRDGTIAVGATSERDFQSQTDTDTQLDTLLSKACQLVPALKDMPVIERWSGLRPRGNGRDPMLGRIDGQTRSYAMMAGFKISFGIAAKAADCVLDQISGAPLQLPETFTVAHHIEKSG